MSKLVDINTEWSVDERKYLLVYLENVKIQGVENHKRLLEVHEFVKEWAEEKIEIKKENTKEVDFLQQVIAIINNQRISESQKLSEEYEMDVRKRNTLVEWLEQNKE